MHLFSPENGKPLTSQNRLRSSFTWSSTITSTLISWKKVDKNLHNSMGLSRSEWVKDTMSLLSTLFIVALLSLLPNINGHPVHKTPEMPLTIIQYTTSTHQICEPRKGCLQTSFGDCKNLCMFLTRQFSALQHFPLRRWCIVGHQSEYCDRILSLGANAGGVLQVNSWD